MARPKGSKDKKPQHKWTDEEKRIFSFNSKRKYI